TETPAAVQELLTELGSVAECSLEAERRVGELSAILRAVGAQLEPHANRAEVTIAYDAGRNIMLKTAETTLEVLVRNLLLHAIAATPRGGRHRASVNRTDIHTAL